MNLRVITEVKEECIHELIKLVELLFIDSPYSDNMLPAYKLVPPELLESVDKEGSRRPIISLKAGRLNDLASACLAARDISGSIDLPGLQKAFDALFEAGHFDPDSEVPTNARRLIETLRQFLESSISASDSFVRIAEEIRLLSEKEENRIGDIIVAIKYDLSPMLGWICLTRRVHLDAVKLYGQLTAVPGFADKNTLPERTEHSGIQNMKYDPAEKIRGWHSANLGISIP